MRGCAWSPSRPFPASHTSIDARTCAARPRLDDGHSQAVDTNETRVHSHPGAESGPIDEALSRLCPTWDRPRSTVLAQRHFGDWLTTSLGIVFGDRRCNPCSIAPLDPKKGMDLCDVELTRFFKISLLVIDPAIWEAYRAVWQGPARRGKVDAIHTWQQSIHTNGTSELYAFIMRIWCVTSDSMSYRVPIHRSTPITCNGRFHGRNEKMMACQR